MRQLPFARVHGSYAALRGGQPIVALRDFTGGVCETYNLKKLPEETNLYEVMNAAFEKKSLIGYVQILFCRPNLYAYIYDKKENTTELCQCFVSYHALEVIKH